MSDDTISRLNAALEGRYRIERQLGEGGMATVYLAEDLKHKRKVALKVLKPELAAVVGAERFLAEIETTAGLQHPHILPLFDSGEAGGFLFYVMPWVEGESLRDRIDREHQLPLDEAVAIVTKVAGALRAAHEHGVIHRDIKPANILLSKGEPLVSDFGIALALSAGGAGRLTETGLSLGTPHYMSPEQATGDTSVGPATDVYALGCVLYEMLIGEPPYTGSTPQAILGKILQSDPVSATKARRSVPAHVDAVIRKALEKIPADRFTSAHALASALADPSYRHGASAAAAGAGQGASVRRGLPWALAAAFAAVAFVLALRPSDDPTVEVVRFTIPLVDLNSVQPGDQAPFTRYASREVAVSPDGQLIVWRANFPAPPRLYMRRLDQETGVALEGTERGVAPTFSPDGEWIAFVELAGQAGQDRVLKRLSLVDRRVETVATAPFTDVNTGLTWGDDGMLVVNANSAFFRVPASGGEWEEIRPSRQGPLGWLGSPFLLPGGGTLLYHVRRTIDPSSGEVRAIDLATGDEKALVSDAMSPVFLPSGYLVFARSGTVMAVRFDARRIEVQGQPVPMLEGVMQALYAGSATTETGAAQIAVSATGTLVYAGGGLWPEEPDRVVRLTAAGDTVLLLSDGRGHASLRVSPDGQRLALATRRGVGRQELWVHDLTRGVTQRLETQSTAVVGFEWSPDGASLVYGAFVGEDPPDLYRISANGGGTPERLTNTEDMESPGGVGPDGSVVYVLTDLTSYTAGTAAGEIWILPPDGAPRPFVTGEGGVSHPTFSPDGRWLAYLSNANGSRDLYIRPYPGPGAPTLVTNGRGGVVSPAWSRDGRRLYYKAVDLLARGYQVMAVDVSTDDGLRVGTPQRVATADRAFTPFRAYDVFPDGSIVDALGVGPAQPPGVRELHVVVNFAEELRTRLPE